MMLSVSGESCVVRYRSPLSLPCGLLVALLGKRMTALLCYIEGMWFDKLGQFGKDVLNDRIALVMIVMDEWLARGM